MKYLLMSCLILLCSATGADTLQHTQLLASSCASCHGTQGYSSGGIPGLAGLSEQYFTEQMRQFKSGERSSTIMAYHASAYTDEEIKKLAEYFSQQ